MGEVIANTMAERVSVSVKIIERNNRLGKAASERARPVILSLGDISEKRLIISNTKLLKETHLCLNEDLSRNV